MANKKTETPEMLKGTAKNTPELMNEEQLAEYSRKERIRILAEAAGIKPAEAEERDAAFIARRDAELGQFIHGTPADDEGDGKAHRSPFPAPTVKKTADAAGEE